VVAGGEEIVQAGAGLGGEVGGGEADGVEAEG
jgi:hypothetical protein